MRRLAPPGALLVALACATGGGGSAPLVRLDRAWPVMGTLFQATALAPDSAVARAALLAARDEVFGVDSLMSTWKPESELSRLNAAAGDGRWMALSPSTIEVLDAALAWAERSGGAFDPTVGPLVQAWGFHGGEGRVPPAAELDSLRALTDWRAVDVERGAARLARAGAKLDFGAIAKGYALDRALRAMAAAGAAGGMVDLGGQLSVFGPSPEGRAGWPLGILDPRDRDRAIGRVTIEAGSVATSGDYERFIEIGGVRYSHILDPRTGRPVRGIAQVTVIAPSGIDADALSTTLFVLGPHEGAGFLARWAPGATAVWVRDPGGRRLTRADIRVAGANARAVELLP